MGSAEEERKRRLALALRENLKRRKAQDRARKSGETPVRDGPDSAGPPVGPPSAEPT